MSTSRGGINRTKLGHPDSAYGLFLALWMKTMYNVIVKKNVQFDHYTKQRIKKLQRLCEQRDPLPIKAIEKMLRTKVIQFLLDMYYIKLEPIYVTRHNLMSGKPIQVALGTPLCCDPSSETYWSM